MKRPIVFFLCVCIAGCATPAVTPDSSGTKARISTADADKSAKQKTKTALAQAPQKPSQAPPESKPEIDLPGVCEAFTEPAPFGSLTPADVRLGAPGYSAEWFVPPSAFNMPLGVYFTPSGEMWVHSVRGTSVHRVTEDGKVTLITDKAGGYAGDMGADGILYLYMMPDGSVTKVEPDGRTSVLVRSESLRSDCDTAIGIGRDGNIYLSSNPCSQTGSFFRLTPQGELTLLAENVPALLALRTAPDGRLIGVSSNRVYEVGLEDYAFRLLAEVPAEYGLAHGGLAIGEDGTIYLSSGARGAAGAVYRLREGAKAEQLARIEGNGLSGIAWNRATREVVGGQLRQGGLIAVAEDGSQRLIVPGNGLVTPMGMAFSPCGELAVNNDDGGMMTLVDAAGRVAWFFDYVSYVPPVSYLAFAPDATLYVSEAAPSLKPIRVAMLPPGANTLQTLADADMPSGIAIRRDGTVVVAETAGGRIREFHPDGGQTILAEGLEFPTAIALDAEENLYVVVGDPSGRADASHPPMNGDTLLRITPQGEITLVAEPGWLSAIAFGPDGGLYLATGGAVSRLRADGRVETFAAGLRQVMGLAFDMAGNLYAADPVSNGIARIGGFPQGKIRIRVQDEQGAPVPGAEVRIHILWPGVAGRLTRSGTDGGAAFFAAPGVYSVTAKAGGFQAATAQSDPLSAGGEMEIVITLRKG